MNARQFDNALRQLALLFQQGQFAQARRLGTELSGHAPDHPGLLSLLGSLHGRLGEYGKAEACFRKLAAREPTHFQHHLYLGLARVMQGRQGEALPALTEALRLNPGFAEGHMQLGCLLRDLGQQDAAIRHLERARELAPALLEATVFLGNLRVFRGEYAAALACFESVLAQTPDHPDATAGKALVLEKQGEYDAAWAVLASAEARGLATPALAIAYALLAPRYGTSDPAQRRLVTELTRPGLTPTQRREILSALARLCDKAGQYQEAFRYCQAAHQLNPLRFDIAAHHHKVDRILAAFPASPAPARITAAPEDTPTPIFIVGMPRSGTSLAEQILACHPDVAAAGELETLPALEPLAERLCAAPGGYPECLHDASSDTLGTLAASYLASLTAVTAVTAGKRYVTDKLPANYERLGLIARLFPNARVIHLVRDARDTCLSCYFQNFGHTQAYASDLRTLAAVYYDYERLMAQWRTTQRLPILDVPYASLVRETAQTVRTMLDFCGLPWHAGCLDFHQSRRTVHTASYDQVRRPVYDSSIGRWRHYEVELQALSALLAGGRALS